MEPHKVQKQRKDKLINDKAKGITFDILKDTAWIISKADLQSTNRILSCMFKHPTYWRSRLHRSTGR